MLELSFFQETRNTMILTRPLPNKYVSYIVLRKIKKQSKKTTEKPCSLLIISILENTKMN